MDFQTIKEYFSPENMDHIVESYKAFGPLLGIGLPMIEALIPALPLIVFVLANAVAFGFWLGFFIHGLISNGCITCLFHHPPFWSQSFLFVCK